MKWYQASICKNGHCISNKEESSLVHCQECGQEIISHCLYCKMPIHGTRKIPHQYEEFNYDFAENRYTIPKFCWNCGSPYPWTERAIENAKEILEDEIFDEDKKNTLISSLPDIISETPKTIIAAKRFKEYIPSFKSDVQDWFRQFFLNFCCDLAINLLMG